MHSHSIDDYRHGHVFLGEAHERNERKTWGVIALCAAMMVAEIFGGYWFGSVALIADGLHMSTHAGALLIAALAYTTSRRYERDERLAFGTGKFGDLAAFTSAIVLAMIALLIGYESVERLVRHHLVIFVTMEDAELADLTEAEPTRLRDLATAVTADGLARQRQLVLQRLRHLGVDVIEAPWQAIGYRLLDRYLAAKRAEAIG